MVQFDNDTIDESESMKEVIQEGKTLLRMKVRFPPRFAVSQGVFWTGTGAAAPGERWVACLGLRGTTGLSVCVEEWPSKDFCMLRIFCASSIKKRSDSRVHHLHQWKEASIL